MLNILLKLKNKKGFTMIEMIVVLVIIAILAAAAIPTMLGYINQARDSQYMTEARVTYTAAQTIISEMKAMEVSYDTTIEDEEFPDIYKTKYYNLIEGSGIHGSATSITSNSDGNITELVYETNAVSPKRTVTINADGTVVERTNS